MRCSAEQPRGHHWARVFVFRLPSVPLTKVLKKESEKPRKSNISRTGLAADSVHHMIEYKTSEVKHSISDQGVEDSELKQVELVKASRLVAKTFTNDASDQFPSSRETLTKNELLAPGALKGKVVANNREAGTAFSFVGVRWIFVENGEA